MTKTEDLLKSATQKVNDGDSLTVIRPTLLKQLVELVRLQHEALKKYEQRQCCEDLEYAGYAGEEAIAAYERFEKVK